MTLPPPSGSVQKSGFTTLELLFVLSLSAFILGSLVVSFGTLSRSRPNASSTVTAALGTTRLVNYYSNTDPKNAETPTAPNYGTLAVAEKLREQFYADTIGATGVFCLSREGLNTYRPHSITFNPAFHAEIDSPERFREHLVSGINAVPATLFKDYRNPFSTASSQPTSNASIFILGFSDEANKLRVLALYEIDVVRYTNKTSPQGFHASVKRYSENPTGRTFSLSFSGGYAIFYPPSIPVVNQNRTNEWDTDGFTPLYITFERSTRLSILEGTTVDRFKVAAERPFYFIWWPDPGARHLGAVANSGPSLTDPRQAYFHMAGRTSFMFTVPMFPSI